MTNEPKSKTEPWVEKHRARYPYAYDPKAALMRYFGVTGIPHAVLVDPAGKIVWRGHPTQLGDATVEASLKDALEVPMWEWPAAAQGVRKDVLARRWAGALEGAQQLSEEHEGPQIAKAVRALMEARVQRLRGTKEQGNLLDARELARSLVEELEGLPEKQQAVEVAAAIESDPSAQSVIAAQQRVRALRDAGLRKKKELQAAMDELRKIQKEQLGTYAAEEARLLLERLQQMR